MIIINHNNNNYNYYYYYYYISPVMRTARLLTQYSPLVVKNDQTWQSEESGKPLLCILSYKMTSRRRGGESNISPNPKDTLSWLPPLKGISFGYIDLLSLLYYHCITTTTSTTITSTTATSAIATFPLPPWQICYHVSLVWWQPYKILINPLIAVLKLLQNFNIQEWITKSYLSRS